MADTEIDLYADVAENELDTGTDLGYETNGDSVQNVTREAELFDDVATGQTEENDFVEMTHDAHQSEMKNDLFVDSNSNGNGTKRISLYIGQLTWWTTDTDLTDALRDLGITDLHDFKFHENRVNGQSKGFAVVTVGSEVSSRIIFEKLTKRDIHGQVPMVLPCNKQSLSLFEGATNKDMPFDSMTGMVGVTSPPRPMMRPPICLPLPLPRSGHVDSVYGYHPGSVLLPGAPANMIRPSLSIGIGARASTVNGVMSHLSRMPGPHPQSVLAMPPGPRANAPNLIRQSIRPGVSMPLSSMTTVSGQPPSTYYSDQPNATSGNSSHVDSGYENLESQANHVPINGTEFHEVMETNRHIFNTAMSQSVVNASTGNSSAGARILVDAISLIQRSKVADDERCKILINSLQDTLKCIKDQSYGQKSRHRSRSASPRESRKKHRHRSRTPHNRNEHRRSENYDGRHSRDHRRR